RSMYLDYVSPLEAKNEMVKTYGAEFDYWVEFDGKQITGRKISVKSKIGRITSKIYDYGSNILSISAEQDMTELYSAIMPYGSEVEREDGSKRPLTIKDVSWSTSSYPDRKSTRLNSSHVSISYAVFFLDNKTSFILHLRAIEGF